MFAQRALQQQRPRGAVHASVARSSRARQRTVKVNKQVVSLAMHVMTCWFVLLGLSHPHLSLLSLQCVAEDKVPVRFRLRKKVSACA